MATHLMRRSTTEPPVGLFRDDKSHDTTGNTCRVCGIPSRRSLCHTHSKKQESTVKWEGPQANPSQANLLLSAELARLKADRAAGIMMRDMTTGRVWP